MFVLGAFDMETILAQFVEAAGKAGAWVFGIQMSTGDQANLVPSEASYTLVPRLSGKQYDSPPVSTGTLRLMTNL